MVHPRPGISNTARDAPRGLVVGSIMIFENLTFFFVNRFFHDVPPCCPFAVRVRFRPKKDGFFTPSRIEPPACVPKVSASPKIQSLEPYLHNACRDITKLPTRKKLQVSQSGGWEPKRGENGHKIGRQPEIPAAAPRVGQARSPHPEQYSK